MALCYLTHTPLIGLKSAENGAGLVRRKIGLRTALLRAGATRLAACLATPYFDSEGRTIEWHSDTTVPAKPWAECSTEARRQALAALNEAQCEQAALLAQATDSGADAEWLEALQSALNIPSLEHLWLAGNQPVISEWGLAERGLKPDDLPFTHLEPEVAEDKLVTMSLKIQPEVEVRYWRPAVKQKRRPMRLALVALPLLLIAGITGSRMVSGPQMPDKPRLASHNALNQPARTPLPALLPLPLARAQIIAPPEPEQPPAPPKNALLMPEAAVKSGRLAFLNGRWKVAISDSQAPVMRYRLDGERGTARLTLASGLVCNSTLYSGLLPSGTLMIKSRARARCSDGSRHPMPEIACRADASRVARCQAQFSASQPLAVTLTRVNS
ncbi:virulence factor [Salmonella enterica subsp. enterica serovar Choleraesuis]|nr:virulence factor [Salmonella enterica subsp. enterica serovar Choleraesuis]